jgi:peptidyl-prolyl cis-trans isomerase SurA
MIPKMIRFLPLALLALLLSGCTKSPPANVAATVNGRAITYTELERDYQMSTLGGNTEGSNEDHVQIQKLELLRARIDNEIMFQRAEKLNLLASDSDVDAKIAEVKAGLTQEEFQRQLQNRKMTLDDLKTQVKRELSIQKLMNKEITSHINITDAEIKEFYETNKANFNLAEPQVRLARIVVTPGPDADVRNLKNDNAQTPEEAKRKIESINLRLRQGEDFSMLAQNYSEDANTAPNGGDLGYVPESALEKAHPELRKMVMALAPGQTSGIISTQEGYQVLKVVSKEPSGQRELNDPKVQQSIRELLLGRKEQLLRNAYFEMARNESEVVNYLARRVIDSAGAAKS